MNINIYLYTCIMYVFVRATAALTTRTEADNFMSSDN